MRFFTITVFYIICMQVSFASANQEDTPVESSIYNMSPYTMFQSIFSMVNNIIKNRIIVGYIAGQAILPSQYLFNHDNSKKIIDNVCAKNNFDKINISYNNLQMKAIICYPPNWNRNDKSKCTLFCNPNAMIISSFIDTDNHNIEKDSIIAELLKTSPVVLYDHPNTGINCDVNEGIMTRFIPFLKSTTENQIIDYAEIAMQYVADNFHKICVSGMSLGGGVATIALERYLSKNKNVNPSRFQLINIDSFRSIPRVVLPKNLKTAGTLGWLLGINMDAQTAMEYLISRNISILVFNHYNDSVIPFEARMHEFTKDYTEANIRSIGSTSFFNHCEVDKDLINQLQSYIFR